MMQNWDKDIQNFVSTANKHQVRMLMVGGGAVNFHGYQRHSADVDFWIETSEENLEKLVLVFKEMGYDFNDFPEAVKNQEQNISVKFSPAGLDLELITRFSVNKSFEEAFNEAEEVHLKNGNLILKWRVLSLNDLITSKIKSGRPKDLMDISELKKVNSLRE